MTKYRKQSLLLILIAIGFTLTVTLIITIINLNTHHQQSQATSTITTHTSTTPLNKQELINIAYTFEHASRDWGINPTTITQYSQQDTSTLLQAIRTPTKLNNNQLTKISAITPPTNAGPNAPSTYCTNNITNPCQDYPTQLDYQRATHWTLGAHIVPDSLQATIVNNNQVKVTGKIQIIVWSSNRNAAQRVTSDHTHWWAFTPFITSTQFQDELTINSEHKVSKRTGTINRWFFDPWYSPWTDNAADWVTSYGDHLTPNIPIKGTPAPLADLNPSPGEQQIQNLTTTTGPLWDALPQGNTIPINPGEQQPKQLDPDQDLQNRKTKQQ